jgi:hypothetical protein
VIKKTLALALGFVLALAGVAAAQTSTGNIYGVAKDESGAVLPGVNATLTSDFGTRSTVSGADGTFRFIGLTRGEYNLVLALPGFASIARKVRVTTGENVDLEFGMKVSGVAETVEVQAETPLVDSKRRGTATTMTTEELSQVPNARDPWGVLKNVPGVLLDRVNIAGNENGQQASSAGKGSPSDDHMWNIDGLVVTDMSATGASPTYFDFDAFQEISVTTGGADLAVQSGGIGINMTTKRGTNAFHGGARYFLAHDDMSSGNVPDQMKNDPRLKGSDKADHIQQISDYGFDFGGPIVKDKLWFYGSYGKQDIRLTRLVQTADKTLLPSYNGKLNWQATGSTMVSAFYFLGSKQKFGRGVGFPLNETDEFLWNQDNAFTEGGLPGGLWKAQIDHTFSPNFFVSAKAAYYDTGFGLFPRGGMDQTYTLDYVEGEAIGSYQEYQAIRPQKIVSLDGNYFFTGTGGSHELKFGFNYRSLKTTSSSAFGGDGLAGIINAPDDKIAYVWRNGLTEYGGSYTSAYLGDVYTRDRFTLNAGLRWDLQTAKNFASEAPGNKAFSSLIPAVAFDGNSDNVIEWNSISPRVGMSYALNESRRTILRASYANYADQLSFGWANRENPIQYGYLAYSWNDANNDRKVQPGEVNLNDYLYNFNIDPDNPGAVEDTVTKLDRDLKPKRDHEVVIGIDHEIGANFAVGVAYTWRKGYDWAYQPRIGGACSGEPTAASCRLIQTNEYEPRAPVSANGYTSFAYAPNAALVSAGGGGRLTTNADGYKTTYNGVELTMTKRLSNRWMGRIAFSWNTWTDHWDGTPYSLNADGGNPTRTENDPLDQGGPVTLLSGGSGKASFYSVVPWQLYANALYQMPWGIDLSGALFSRKGGVYPVSIRTSGGADGTNSALATASIDEKTYDDLWNFDLRLAKTFKFGKAGMTLSAELFNVMNSSTVLSRYRYANAGPFTDAAAGAEAGLGRIEEVISPRILRVGARFTF